MGITRKMRREKQKAKVEASLAGDGLYIYQNITNSDLYLPRPTKAGRRTVGPREKFIGDSYYKQIKEVICLQEVEKPMAEQQKLMTEIPPTFTNEGQVEFVQETPAKKMNEDDKKSNEDVLLVETPIEGVRIIR